MRVSLARLVVAGRALAVWVAFVPDVLPSLAAPSSRPMPGQRTNRRMNTDKRSGRVDLFRVVVSLPTPNGLERRAQLIST